MFIVAWTCVVVSLSLVFNTAQAFFTAPVPGLVHGASILESNISKRAGSPAESNEVTIGDTLDGDGGNSSRRDHKDEDDRDDERSAVEPEITSGEHTVVVVEFESELTEKDDKGGKKNGKEDDGDNQSPLDPWSIVWYIGSFGGLVAFFLIVSCSEWCCRRGARQLNSSHVQQRQQRNNPSDQANGTNATTETPPPPYHLFAPPPYDSVNYSDLVDKTSGEKIDIYVISMPLPSTAHQPAPA